MKNIRKALKNATGDYIKIIGDDIMQENYIKKLVECYNLSLDEKVIWCPSVDAFPDTDEDILATQNYINKYKEFLTLSQEEKK